MNRRLAALLTVLLFAGAVAVGAYWARDDLKAWLGPLLQRARPVQASALGECHAPVEGERLLIVVVKHGGKLRVDACMFVGSRGTYSPRAKGAAL